MDAPDSASDDATDAPAKRADLVMQAGGVKGVAFAGAVAELGEAGFSFPRVAGTSAGAISAALVAALQHAGEPLARMVDIAETMNLSKFPDSGAVGKALGPLHALADWASFVFQGGLYEGDYLHDWVAGVLRDLGVSTFGDLKRDDPGSALPPEQEYALVVVTSDIAEHRLSLFPWDYPHYGLDPDEQPVADAVRASTSIPYFYQPATMPTRRPEGVTTLVDGGLLSMYPITIFDQPADQPSRWPTFGIRVTPKTDTRALDRSITHPVDLSMALVETMLEGWDRRNFDDPAEVERTVFIDTSGISGLDFDLSEEQRRELVAHGRRAARRFLDRWDFATWTEQFRAGH